MASNGVGMARTSGYVIVLGEAERAELEHRVACYTLPHKVVVRAKIVLYAAEGQSNVESASVGDGGSSGRPLAETLLRGAAGGS